MSEPRSALYKRLLQGRIRLAKVVASRGLKTIITKYVTDARRTFEILAKVVAFLENDKTSGALLIYSA